AIIEAERVKYAAHFAEETFEHLLVVLVRAAANDVECVAGRMQDFDRSRFRDRKLRKSAARIHVIFLLPCRGHKRLVLRAQLRRPAPPVDWLRCFSVVGSRCRPMTSPI